MVKYYHVRLWVHGFAAGGSGLQDVVFPGSKPGPSLNEDFMNTELEIQVLNHFCGTYRSRAL
jgi:hypothetical protein